MSAVRRERSAAIVTGAGGFVGGHLVRHLADCDIEVVAISRSAPNSRPHARVHWVTADVVDTAATLASVAAVLERARVTAASAPIYHLSGLADRHACAADPVAAFRANVASTAALLDIARQLNTPGIVYASTGLVYEHVPGIAVDEAAPTRASSVYAATKLAAESLIAGYSAEYSLGGIALRFATVYGAGMAPSSVLGTLLRQASAGQRLEIRSGAPTRDFVYVTDAVDALPRAASQLGTRAFVVYNVSSGVACSVGAAARILADLSEPSLELIETAPEDAGRQPWMVLSNARMQAATGWQPRYSLADGLAASIREFQSSGS